MCVCVCVCKGVLTPPKKRRLTADAMSSGSSFTLAEDSSTADKHTTWPSVDEQFESRRRMLASRNLFEVRSYVFSCRTADALTRQIEPFVWVAGSVVNNTVFVNTFASTEF